MESSYHQHIAEIYEVEGPGLFPRDSLKLYPWFSTFESYLELLELDKVRVNKLRHTMYWLPQDIQDLVAAEESYEAIKGLIIRKFGPDTDRIWDQAKSTNQKEGESILDYYRRLFKVCFSAGFSIERIHMLFRTNLLPCIRSEMPKGEMQLGESFAAAVKILRTQEEMRKSSGDIGLILERLDRMERNMNNKIVTLFDRYFDRVATGNDNQNAHQDLSPRGSSEGSKERDNSQRVHPEDIPPSVEVLVPTSSNDYPIQELGDEPAQDTNKAVDTIPSEPSSQDNSQGNIRDPMGHAKSSTRPEVCPQECHSDIQVSDCVDVSENVSKGENERCDKVSDQKGMQRNPNMVKSNNTEKAMSQTKVCDKICVQTVDEKVVITPSDKIETCSQVNTNKLCLDSSQGDATDKVETTEKCLVTNITERDHQVLDEKGKVYSIKTKGKRKSCFKEGKLKERQSKARLKQETVSDRVARVGNRKPVDHCDQNHRLRQLYDKQGLMINKASERNELVYNRGI